jgi:hypothetical protein
VSERREHIKSRRRVEVRRDGHPRRRRRRTRTKPFQSEAGGGCFERRAPRVLDSDVGGVHVTDTITIARRISPARRVWGCVWRSALIRARVRVVVMDARGMGDAGATRGGARGARARGGEVLCMYNNLLGRVMKLATSRTTPHELVAVAVRRGEIGRDAAIEYVVDEGLWHASEHPRRKPCGYAWVASTAFDQITRTSLRRARRLETSIGAKRGAKRARDEQIRPFAIVKPVFAIRNGETLVVDGITHRIHSVSKFGGWILQNPAQRRRRAYEIERYAHVRIGEFEHRLCKVWTLLREFTPPLR